MKLMWRVKPMAELHPGVATETELSRIERDADVSLADLGLRLAEAKQLVLALLGPLQEGNAGWHHPKKCESRSGHLRLVDINPSVLALALSGPAAWTHAIDC